MPELPEVETVRVGLQPAMEGARFDAVALRRGDLRFPLQQDFAARLTGQSVLGLARRAKYLLADLSNGDVLLMHLGMSGSLRVIDGGAEIEPGTFHYARCADRNHDHVVFAMSSGKIVVFNDPRRFGYMKVFPRSVIAEEPFLRGLGPEPLGNAFDAEMLARVCAGKTVSLKAMLLGQRAVAGLGNIYACEALFRAKLDPTRPAATLADPSGAPTAEAERLVEAIRTVLAEAIRAGGSSLRDQQYRQASGELGYFQHSFQVYDRAGKPCLTKGCRGTIVRFNQSNRSTFWCPSCQR
jgi:formamidopyrimidine-DNA glycosylase